LRIFPSDSGRDAMLKKEIKSVSFAELAMQYAEEKWKVIG
jgi:hypothetical protein